METIECKNCGSSALELVGNEYVCQACGSRFQASELFSTPQSESTAQLTEEQKAELKRLKANLKDDHSLGRRVLELDPYDWEAYYYTYSLSPSNHFDRWLGCLQRSGLSVKEIENILSAYYYENQKKLVFESKDWVYYSNDPWWGDNLKKALSVLLDFKETLHSKEIHIKSILGEEYSSLIQKWEADWVDTSTRYTKQLQNKHEEREKELEEAIKKDSTYGWTAVVIGVIFCIVGFVQIPSATADTILISSGWIVGGAALACTGAFKWLV